MSKLMEMMGPCIHVKVKADKVDVYFQNSPIAFTVHANRHFFEAMTHPNAEDLHELCIKANPSQYAEMLGTTGGKTSTSMCDGK